MPENLSDRQVWQVDDEPAVLTTFSRILRRATDLVHHPFPNGMAFLEALSGVRDRVRGVAILDGNAKGQGPNGHEIVQRLLEERYLVGREQVLSQGVIQRGQLVAILLSGGLPEPEKKEAFGDSLKGKTAAALDAGLFAGAVGKPFDLNSLTLFLSNLTSDDPEKVSLALEWLQQSTEDFQRHYL